MTNLPCFFSLYQISDMGTLRLKFHQSFVITASFEAETSRLSWGHEESSVYAAAMLKSQTVWFMAAGRDRDQRSVSCWVCSRFPWLLFPLSQEPNTEPGHQDRAGEFEEFSQHICSLLCNFSPLWGCKECRRPWGCDHLAQQWVSARVGERRPWAEDQGNLADGKGRASGMAHCWESESSWIELLSFGQHNKD